MIYHAVFTRDGDGGFAITVDEVPGCLTHGVSWQECFVRVREALSLFVDDAHTATIIAREASYVSPD